MTTKAYQVLLHHYGPVLSHRPMLWDSCLRGGTAMVTLNDGVDVLPDMGAVRGKDELVDILGALMTLVLVVAVLMLIVAAVTWALSSWSGQYLVAARARVAVWVSLGGAAFAGTGVAWINFLIDVGTSLH
jgi:hypothetical protein